MNERLKFAKLKPIICKQSPHTCVPVKESFPPEHGSELLGNSLKQLLDGSGVTDEGGGHLQSSGRDVTHRGLHVVGDPFDKVGAVLVLDVKHLLVNLLHGHAATEDSCHGQVSAVSGVARSHHVLSVKHLLG